MKAKSKAPRKTPKSLTFATRPFWSNFSRVYWEKKPGAFPSVAATTSAITAIDALEIFKLLVKYSDRCRERDSLDGLKFYVDGVRLESFEALEHLPVSSDLTLEGYHQRMSADFSDYGLVCDELMQVLPKPGSSSKSKSPNVAIREILGSFVRGLYEFTGIPNRFSEMGLYLGNYKRTPFGVHVDPCGVFSIPVIGQKTFRLWDPAFVEKNTELKEAFSYEEFKKKSVVITAGVGDVTYWPSSYWHIAENDGTFNCTWSIGVWVDRPLSDVVIETLTPLIAKSLGAIGKRTTLKLPNNVAKEHNRTATNAASRTSGAELPPELAAAAKTISKLSESQIQKILTKWWRDHKNRDGFNS